jgi:hypothetical protein
VPKRTRRLGGARIDGDLVDCGREGASALINGGRVEKRVVATVRRGGRDLPPTSEIVAERLQAANLRHSSVLCACLEADIDRKLVATDRSSMQGAAPCLSNHSCR